MTKKFEIRNSTVEFLTFVAEGEEQGVQVLYKNETIWATQKAMAMLFDCSTDNIGLHFEKMYASMNTLTFMSQSATICIESVRKATLIPPSPPNMKYHLGTSSYRTHLL